MIDSTLISGVVLAGGQGSRMGGLDKGLQPFNGIPLALNALRRLQSQVGTLMINANRHLPDYAAFGVPVWPDTPKTTSSEAFAGPLAGFLAGLSHCETPYLLTVPCDVPFFPVDLAALLAATLEKEDAEIVVAALQAEGSPLRTQPVFCLMRSDLLQSLTWFVKSGGRKPGAWTAQHKTRLQIFDRPGDVRAFANANTADELQELQQLR